MKRVLQGHVCENARHREFQIGFIDEYSTKTLYVF